MRIKIVNFQTLLFILLFIATAFIMLNNTSYGDAKSQLTLLWLIYFLVFLQYNALNFHTPKGLAFLINAGFNKVQIIFYFGGIYLIVSTLILLFIFPIKNISDLTIFLLFFSYAVLIEITWLVFGLASLILLTLLPIILNFVLTVFFTMILHWDFAEITSHLLIIQWLIIATINLATIIFFHRFFKGDLT